MHFSSISRERLLPPLIMLGGLAMVWLLVSLALGLPGSWTPAFFVAFFLWLGLWTNEGGRPWESRPTLFCFLSSLGLYLSTFRWHGGDDITNCLAALALVKHGTLSLNQVLSPFLDNKAGDFTVRSGIYVLSVHPIATGIVASPLFAIPIACGAAISETFLHNLSKISASLITAASVAAFYRACAARYSKHWALALALAYGGGSFAFSVSSQALWQHGLAQLGVALGLWGLSESTPRGDVLAGFGFALSVAARPDGIFFAAAAAAYLLFDEPWRLRRFLSAAMAVALPLVAYWHHYTGRFVPVESSFQAGIFGGFDRRAFLGLALSPTRGLLAFCPAALFGFLAIARRPGSRQRLALWLAVAAVVQWVFLAHYVNWVAGMTYGPRYLCLVSTAGLWLCGELEDVFSARPLFLASWVACAAFGIWVHALGGYLTWPGSFAIAAEKDHIWDWSLHPLLNLLSSSGALGALPWPARAAAVAAMAIATAILARAMVGALSMAHPEPVRSSV